MSEKEFKEVLKKNGKADQESEKKAEQLVDEAKRINTEIQESI